MQFQVPQFIDVAPKIVGPLTLRQFLYLAAAAVPTFILFFFLKFWLWLIVAGFLSAIAAVAAFAKVNGQPLSRVGFAAFWYFWNPRFFLWKSKPEAGSVPAELPRVPKPELPSLKDLIFKIVTTSKPIETRERISKPFLKRSEEPERYESIRRTSGEREAARRVDYR
jgi:hypothetical protein